MAKLSSLLLAVLTVAARCVVAQDFYNGDEYLAPQAASAMAAMSASYAQYVHFTPPPQASDGPGVNVLAKSKTKTSSATPTSTACAYWMDEIKHQGVAAFNDNTSMSRTNRSVDMEH